MQTWFQKKLAPKLQSSKTWKRQKMITHFFYPKITFFCAVFFPSALYNRRPLLKYFNGVKKSKYTKCPSKFFRGQKELKFVAWLTLEISKNRPETSDLTSQDCQDTWHVYCHTIVHLRETFKLNKEYKKRQKCSRF